MSAKISVLVAARKNSKYLAKFLFGYFENTDRPEDLEILVCMNAGDTWNRELVLHYSDRVTFITEDMQLGRAGLHEYFNLLAKEATGDWLIYFCEDHFIMPSELISWDQYFLNKIRILQMNHRHVYCLVPKFDNVGAMNHMVSRGFYEAMGSVIGRHGWIDSYINDVTLFAWGRHTDRLVRMDSETFHDFTHDKPTPMDDANLQSVVSAAGRELIKHGSSEYRDLIAADAQKLREVTA